jgi:peptide/nickel transport system permease protein
LKTARRFFSHWQNWLGLLLVLFFVFVAIAAPKLSPMDPNNPGIVKQIGTSRHHMQPQPPSPEAPLGTFSDQSSVYHMLVWGANSAISFGLTVAIFSMVIGVLIGILSANSNRFVDNLLMRITDGFLAFPMLAAIFMVQEIKFIIVQNSGFIDPLTGMFITQNFPFWFKLIVFSDSLKISFILLSWMPYARIMNSVVHQVKKMEYIEAARISGLRPGKILFRHILPNAISPAIILAARDVGGMVILQTTFGFVGFGGSSPWASSLIAARDWIISGGGHFDFWWVFLPTTLAIILFGIGWNLLGDGLNDLLNPRSR